MSHKLISSTQLMWLNQYKELWNNFWDEIREKKISPIGAPVPHLPHCGNFEEYNKSRYKIAVVGIDAYGWGNDLEKYSDLETYLDECQSNMDGSNWGYSNPIFWNFVFKFLGELYGKEWKDIKADPESQIVQGLVWGNMKSIWKDSDTDMRYFTEIKRASAIFDNLEYLLKVYDPEIVLMLNYSDTSAFYNYLPKDFDKYYQHSFENGAVDYYLVNNTKIFIAYHPRAMRSLSIDEQNVINGIIACI